MGFHRRLAPTGLHRGATAAVGLLSVAAAPRAPAPATATPHDDRRAEVDRLYTEAEQATEAYNKADARTDALREEVSTAADPIARQQERINTMRDALGSLAGAQYRSGGIDPSLALLLSADPTTTWTRPPCSTGSPATRPVNSRNSRAPCATSPRTVPRPAGSSPSWRRAARPSPPTRRPWSVRSRRPASCSTPFRTANAPPTTALPPGRTDLSAPGDAGPVSGRAAAAVAAARSALGKPYVWGANGPTGSDCSGLTQWSYAQAGVGLPRTSQAQSGAGQRVSLAQARPGDLVAYRDDASHIGMYVGNGQGDPRAPTPGAPVRYDPVGMMPVSSVTRV